MRLTRRVLLLPGPVLARTLGQQEAAEAFARGAVSPGQEMLFFAHKKVINLLAQEGMISMPAYKTCQEDFDSNGLATITGTYGNSPDGTRGDWTGTKGGFACQSVPTPPTTPSATAPTIASKSGVSRFLAFPAPGAASAPVSTAASSVNIPAYWKSLTIRRAAMTLRLLPLCLPLLLCGCIMDAVYGHLPNAVSMEPAVHALDGLNGPFDEFNAVAGPPPLKIDAFIAFASNDASGGGLFNVDVGRLELLQNPYPDRRQSRPPAPATTSRRLGAFVHIPDMPGNVRGPTPLASTKVPERRYEEPFEPYMTRDLTLNQEPLSGDGSGVLPLGGVWMFDSDHEGRRNLYFVEGSGRVRPFFGNLAHADDAYATYDFTRHELLFCSNRSGSYRLYRYHNASGNMNFSEWLGNALLAQDIIAATEFDAPGQTMAPFVSGDLLVFASDRPGGWGGFDLYLSQHVDGGWKSPINLQGLMPSGVELNTPGSEFRPSLLTLGFTHFQDLNVILFSSDRPGGQGGYDLYLTALPPL